MAKAKSKSTEPTLANGKISELSMEGYRKGNVLFSLSDIDNDEMFCVSTGSVRLDMALQHPLQRGIHHIVGSKGTFKTTYALSVMQQAVLKYGDDVGLVYFVLEPDAITRQMVDGFDGLDPQRIHLVLPDNGEQAVDMLEEFVVNSRRLVIVLDSIARLIPAKIRTMETADAQNAMGPQAKLISIMLAKVGMPCIKNQHILLCLNQVRQNLSMYGGKKYPGGKAFEHDATTELMMSATKADIEYKTIGDDKIPCGQSVEVTIQKNRRGTPYKKLKIPFLFGKGINRVAELIQLGLELCLVQKKGAWYQLPCGQKLQGQEKVQAYYRDNPEKMADLKKQIEQLIN